MISDPYLKKLIEDAMSGGNDTLGADLDPAVPWMLRRRRMPWDTPGFGGGLADGQPQGPVMPPGAEAAPTPEPRLSLAQRLGPLMMPNSTITKQAPGRLFLRGLVSGFNSKAGAGGGSTAGLTPYQQAQLGMSRERLDLAKGNTATDNEAAAQRLELAKQQYDLAVEKSKWAMAHGDETAAQGWQRIAETMAANAWRKDQGQQRIGISLEGLGIRKANLGLAKQREARQQQVAAAYPKWSPQMKMEHDSEVRAAFSTLKDDPESLDAALDAINARYLAKSQQIQNPFQDPYLPGGNTVKTGKSSTAKTLKTSQTPGLDPKTKAFYEAQGD